MKKKKKAKTLLAGVVACVVVLLIVGALLPSKWKVERSVVIHARSEVIYPLVANLKVGWPQWSAFDHEDPSIQYSYSGPEEGAGAARKWISRKMGNGSQRILKGTSNSGIEFELEMEMNPSILTGQLVFEPITEGTKVTWRDVGDVGSSLFYRYMVAFMDQLMGPTFEKSLAALKEKAEAKSLK